MNDILGLEGRQDLEGADVAYFMNATDDPGSEGYSQLLPVAASEGAGAKDVTIFTCGIYGPVNAETIEEMEKGDEENAGFESCPEVDERKAAFLDSYSDERGLGFDSRPVERLMDDAYWEGLEEAAESVTPEKVRGTAPFGKNWFDNLDAAVALDSMPIDVSEGAREAVSSYSGRELYTLLQLAEYSAAQDQGFDVVTGIASEEVYQNLAETQLNLGIDFARSEEPVDLEGENRGKPPYVESERDWVRLDDSPQEVARKLEQADQIAVEQIQDIARQLDDGLLQEVSQ